MSDSHGDGDFYLAWTSAAGAYALHGPYAFEHAQQLRPYTPVPSRVVRASTGDHAFALIEAYIRSGITAPHTAFTTAGVWHIGSRCPSAVSTALAHALQDAPTGLTAMAEHLAGAGFRALI